MPGHHFISYSTLDGKDFAFKLYDALMRDGISAWLDKRNLRAGDDWDTQIDEAIRDCDTLLFVLTPDSIRDNCTCKQEWIRALKYKKPIVPLHAQRDAQLPFRLEPRQWIEFTRPFDSALAELRQHFQYLKSPAGVLHELEHRLADAERDLLRPDSDRPRIEADITQLRQDIEKQKHIVADPEAAAKRTEASIAAGLERERAPEKPVSGIARTKFINPPPATAPTYFQDRYEENKLIRDFLRDESKRLLTINGRAGIGKTAMVCRLLKSLESGRLPDDLGDMRVDGIIYLSAVGTRTINTPNLFADLSKLLPADSAASLDALYRDPKVSTTAKLFALLEKFSTGRVVVLLDNFESVIDATSCCLTDTELDEALRALLNAPHHAVKVILTTRIQPEELSLVQPGRQSVIHLDEGLESPYAEKILREMDADGKVHLRDALDELLGRARVRTRGFPRALEALYAILARDRYTSLEEILGVGDVVGATHASPLPENVVAALVGEAFSRLDATEQTMMSALAAYARPVAPVAVDYLLQPYLPSVDSAPVLNRLVNMQFVHKEAGRYYMHPVDRDYAWRKIPLVPVSPGLPGVDKETRRAGDTENNFMQRNLLTRAADYFRDARKPLETWKTIDDLAPQLAEFDLRCAAEDYDTAANVLLEIDGNYLHLWGHYRLTIELHEELQEKINDQTSAMLSVARLGLCYGSIGQMQKEIACQEKALAIAREQKDRANEGAWLGNLGNAYSDLGETRHAIEFYDRALAIAREIGDKRGEGNRLGNLGSAYSALGETRHAIEFYDRALAIAREIGDKRGEGNRLGNLGSAYSALGETRRAIEFYDRALAIDHEIGDKQGEGQDLGNLGLAYSDLGDTRRAIEFYERALAIDREIGDKRGEGADLDSLTNVLVDELNFVDAITRASESCVIGKQIGYIPLSSFAGRTLALAHLYVGNLLAARAAIEAARQYDVPENNHNVHTLLGIIALRQAALNPKGLPDPSGLGDAQQSFTAAIAHADALLTQTPEYFDALDAKGVALCGLFLTNGETDKRINAIATFHTARKINRDAGIVTRVVRLLDALALAHPDGAALLADARRAAAGE